MQDKTLIKYIKGEANPTEERCIMEWIKKDATHQKRYNRLKAQYVASTLDTLAVPDIDAKYQKFTSRRVRRTYYYAAVAALIALPFAIWYFYTLLPGNTPAANTIQFSNDQTIAVVTHTGDHKKVTLPDGSTVILNAESSLTYPKNFMDSTRQVTLTGEAFFDIKRDTTQPFIVKTEYLSVKVLGTAFNVKSYPGDENIETTLVSGKVEILRQKAKKTLVLAPSQRAVFDKEKSNIKVDSVDSENIIAWKQGKLVFNNTSLKQVISDLNRKYNVEFVIQSEALLHYKYTGTFDNLTLKEVLELLKISSPIHYKHVNNKVVLDLE